MKRNNPIELIQLSAKLDLIAAQAQTLYAHTVDDEITDEAIADGIVKLNEVIDLLVEETARCLEPFAKTAKTPKS